MSQVLPFIQTSFCSTNKNSSSVLSQQPSLREKWERAASACKGFYHCSSPLLQVQVDNWTEALKTEDKICSVQQSTREGMSREGSNSWRTRKREREKEAEKGSKSGKEKVETNEEKRCSKGRM